MTRHVWVAGHAGMVGSAIVRQLENSDDEALVVGRSHVDLRDQKAVELWLKLNKPDAIVFAVAKVGGIFGNESFPADFIYDNLAIETNIIHGAHLTGVIRLAFLGLAGAPLIKTGWHATQTDGFGAASNIEVGTPNFSARGHGKQPPMAPENCRARLIGVRPGSHGFPKLQWRHSRDSR